MQLQFSHNKSVKKDCVVWNCFFDHQFYTLIKYIWSSCCTSLKKNPKQNSLDGVLLFTTYLGFKKTTTMSCCSQLWETHLLFSLCRCHAGPSCPACCFIRDVRGNTKHNTPFKYIENQVTTSQQAHTHT